MNWLLRNHGIRGLLSKWNVRYLRSDKRWQGLRLLWWWWVNLSCRLVLHIGADLGLLNLRNVLLGLSLGGRVLADTMLLVLVGHFDPYSFEDWVEGWKLQTCLEC